MAADMGDRSSLAWESLPADYRHVLKQHDIDAQSWDLIRSTSYVAENGVRYVTPDKLDALSDEAVRPLIQDRLDLIEEGKGEAELTRQMADARERQWIEKRVEKWQRRFGRARDRLTE